MVCQTEKHTRKGEKGIHSLNLPNEFLFYNMCNPFTNADLLFPGDDDNRNAEREIEIFEPESFRAEEFSEHAVERGDVDVVF